MTQTTNRNLLWTIAPERLAPHRRILGDVRKQNVRILLICMLTALSACSVDTDGYTFISMNDTEIDTTSDAAVITPKDSSTGTDTLSIAGIDSSSDSSAGTQFYSGTDYATTEDTETDSNSEALKDSDATTDSGQLPDHGTDPALEDDTSLDIVPIAGIDTESESSPQMDTHPEAETDSNADTSAATHICEAGKETQRVCGADGNVHVVDECGDEMQIVQCASINGICNNGICGCASGWTGEECERCLVYVNGSLNDHTGNDGRSWDRALKTVGDGLGIAEISDCELWVAKGTYIPSLQTDDTDSRTATFQMKSGVDMYGGFTGIENHRHERDIEANDTTLSGDIGTIGDATDNAYHVVTGADNATIDGFTITGGQAEMNIGSGNTYSGGGMFNYGVSPVVRNCIFRENSASTGGGMYNEQANPSIVKCTFAENAAFIRGGGVANRYSNPVISDCIFIENETIIYDSRTIAGGGGIYNGPESGLIISRSVISKNTTAGAGGGVRNSSHTSTPEIIACSFSENSSEKNGGGIYTDSDVIVSNSVFAGNAALGTGGGIHSDGLGASDMVACAVSNSTFAQNTALNGGGISAVDAVITVSNSILWRNTASEVDGHHEINLDETSSATVSHSDVQGGYTGSGNIDLDPRFVNWEAGDFHLSEDSPCIDAGDTAALGADSADLDEDGNTGENTPVDADGNAREVGENVDMGAFENPSLP